MEDGFDAWEQVQVVPLVALLAARFQAVLDARLAELENAQHRALGERVSMMTERDMARLLKCDVRSIRRWERSGEVPQALRVGGAKRWRAETIERWLAGLEEDAS